MHHAWTPADDMGTEVHPPSPSKIKSDQPWLTGTYRTPKGRIITGEELCQVGLHIMVCVGAVGI